MRFKLQWPLSIDKSQGAGTHHTVITASENSPSKIRAFLDKLGVSTISFRGNTAEFAKKGYSQNIDVFSVIKQLSETASTVPWIVEERQSDGSTVELQDTPLHELMRVTNAEKDRDWGAHMFESCGWLLIGGNNYEIKQDAVGFSGVQGLDILIPQFVTINTGGNPDFFDPVKEYQFDLDQTYNFSDDEIMHTKMFNPNVYGVEDTLYGLSPLAAAIMVIQTGNDRWDANAHVLQNKGQIGILTNKSEYPLPPKQVNEMQDEGLKILGGAEKFGRVFWSNKNLDYISMALSTTDLQLLETGPATLRAICNAFGVDSSMFNDPANKRFNNIKEADKRFITRAIQPLLGRFERKYAMDLVPEVMGNRPNIIFRPDYSGVEALQADKKVEADRVRLLVGSGVLTPEQGANELGFEFKGTIDPVVEKLNSLSPIIARDVMSRMSDGQALGLVGLVPEEQPEPDTEPTPEPNAE